MRKAKVMWSCNLLMQRLSEVCTEHELRSVVGTTIIARASVALLTSSDILQRQLMMLGQLLTRFFILLLQIQIERSDESMRIHDNDLYTVPVPTPTHTSTHANTISSSHQDVHYSLDLDGWAAHGEQTCIGGCAQSCKQVL